ncbi:MAG: alanine--glyoxylate aminotransferase family protein [Bryobacterales bacterium]|nr:alanine--glyoxylate aminotransferase family protein [Bryobacterales bacterium]
MHIKKQRLLTPGPTPLLPSALRAMMASDMHHRTQDFQKLYRQVLADLKEVFGTSNDVLPLVSSGSGAMEASISNLFRRGDKVIVCTAGKFGERWVAMTRAFGLDATVLEAPYGDTVSPSRVAEALAAAPTARGVFIQASETSTGAAHDIRAMGEIIRKTPAIFVIDAITGLGTMPLDIDNWGLDVVIGGSQKAFMIPPGLGFISVSPKAWELSKTCDLPHFYFDLKKELKSAQNGESSWTPAVSLIIALADALQYVKQLGMNKLIDNAQLLARATRAAVTAIGLELFSPASPAASVTAVKAPQGMDSSVIVKGFRNEFGMIIANGQGSMKGQIFRIAHLGYFDFADLFAVIGALELILNANGFAAPYGKGVAAAQSVYAEAAFSRETVGAR